jgi:parallel beta-helix repeat protein
MRRTHYLPLLTILAGCLLLVGLAQSAPVMAAGTTYYVAPEGNDTFPGTEAQPWRTIQRAATAMRPGDTTLVKNGLYEVSTKTGSSIRFIQNGSPTAWVTLKAYPGHRPKIVGKTWYAINFDHASYIEVNGFSIQGIPDASSSFSGNGVSASYAHHIRILNNDIYDFPGGGISGAWSDYLDVEGNHVHNNVKLAPYANSAISFINLNHVDTSPNYHNIIRANIVYDNEETIPVSTSNGMAITDGNCIIIDSSRHMQNGVAVNPYVGSTLIENNLCFNNGGRGINVFMSDNVYATNNTLYMNQRTATINDGELSARDASNVKFYNNIVVPLPGKMANISRRTSNVIFGRNLYFNTTDIPVKASDDLIGIDPKFKNASLDPTVADFHLRNDSPAINQIINPYIPLTDLDLNARPFGVAAELGAYEFLAVQPQGTSVPPTALPPTTVPPTATPPPAPTSPTLLLDVQPPNAAVGQNVTVNLKLFKVSNLYGLDVRCNVNPAVLTGASHADGTVFKTGNSFFVDNGYKPDGTWSTAASLLSPAPAFAGDGVAFTLNYRVAAAGSSKVDCNVLAVNWDGLTLDLAIINSAFNSGQTVTGKSVVQPTSTPAPIINSQATPQPTVAIMLPSGPSVDTAPLVIPTNMPIVPTESLPVPVPTSLPSLNTVSGIAAYQNRTTQAGISVRLFSGDTPVVNLVTNANGGFNFTDVPDGTYRIEISAPEHLTVVADVTVSGGQPVSLGAVTLGAGDADDNGQIDLSDAALLGANFYLPVPPGPASADLNADGQIDIADLVLIGSNYGASGPVTVP